MNIRSSLLVSLSALLALSACTAEEPAPKYSCPPADRAQAVALTDSAVYLTGPNAVGAGGDYLLRNDRAAFIISGIDRGTTYYHYGGILVDAVATDRCMQLMDEQFEEMAILLGTLNLADLPASTLRGFRGESVAIVNDGSNGKPAHVRVTGVDDYYWLVEYTLIKETYNAGGVKPLSSPFGLEIVIDYVLAPGSRTLETTLRLRNQEERTKKFLVGTAIIFGDLLDKRTWGKVGLDIGGFNLLSGIPWITGSAGRGAYAYALPGANLAAASISGVNAALDLDQGLNRPLEAPPASSGEEGTMTMLFSVGPTDGHSATRELVKYHPELAKGVPYEITALRGTLTDAGSGLPVSGATVEVLLLNDDDRWLPIEHYVSDEQGAFGDGIADFADGRIYRVVASAPGRNPHDLVEVTLPLAAELEIALPPAGSVAYDIADALGAAMPGKISLFVDGAVTHEFYVAGKGTVPVPPGAYDVSVTRGFEYETYQGTLEVLAGKPAALEARLAHLLDTTGYMSVDTHMHASPSADSRVSLVDRIRTAGAEGLEVAVATDHEAIVGFHAGIHESGWGDWVTSITGQEVTASLPEHSTMLPVVPDGTARGGIVSWYGKGFGGIYEAAYGRGAQVTILNHPKAPKGCDYLCLIRWNRVVGKPDLLSGVPLGLPEDDVWTWDFEGVELLNGFKYIFYDPQDPDGTGLFDDWQSFINHGRRIVAVGASDVHGYGETGWPRSYYASPTDDPLLFREQDLVDAFYDGDILVTTGAFARVSIAGKGMGELASASGEFEVNVHIEAIPEIDVSHFRVYVNCDEKLKVNATAPNDVVKFSAPVTLPATLADVQVTVAGFGQNRLPRGLPQFTPRNMPRFVTNPIYVDADGNGVFDPPLGKECVYTQD